MFIKTEPDHKFIFTEVLQDLLPCYAAGMNKGNESYPLSMD